MSISLPFLSRGLSMLNTDRRVAPAIQTVDWARWIPGLDEKYKMNAAGKYIRLTLDNARMAKFVIYGCPKAHLPIASTIAERCFTGITHGVVGLPVGTEISFWTEHRGIRIDFWIV